MENIGDQLPIFNFRQELLLPYKSFKTGYLDIILYIQNFV